MSSFVTVDKADIATLTAALAAAQDRLNAANEAANVAFRPADFTTAIAAAEQCEAAGARCFQAAMSLNALPEYGADGYDECIHCANEAKYLANHAALRLRESIAAAQHNQEFTAAVNDALSSVYDATAYANRHAAEAEACYRASLVVIRERNEELERQQREYTDKIALLRDTLDKAMNNARKVQAQIDSLDNHTSSGFNINVAVSAASGASILFTSLIEKMKGLGLKQSVFTRPVRLSPQLCSFLNIPNESMLSRSEVTRNICDYAKVNNLLDKQTIKADAALRTLFALTPNDELKILNLQHFLKPHYLMTA